MTSIRTILLAAAALAAAPGLVHAQTANPSPAAVQAGTYAVEPLHTRINFTVNHMGFTDWYGDFTKASGSLTIDPKAPAQAQVDISIPTASVLTVNDTLNEELRSAQWFDAATYPTIHFVSTKVTPTGPRTALITGNLTFHGVTKPVTLKASYNAGGLNPMSKTATIGFNATAQIKRSDFGVKTYVPLIGDDVALRISAAFELKK
jgi:polyisoprenoid-binding protein YceI